MTKRFNPLLPAGLDDIGEGVASIVAGTNVSVDSSDPANPVVSSLADRYRTTSATEQTIVGNGVLTFTVDAGLSYVPQQEVIIAHDAANHIHATVVSYAGTTLVVEAKHKEGSGTYSSWVINLDGTPVDALTGYGTTDEIAYFSGARALASLPVATYPSLAELSRVKGLASPVQTQLDAKANLAALGSAAFLAASAFAAAVHGHAISDVSGLQAALDAKLTTPALAAGSVIFSDGSTLAQDNQNFFFDNSNDRLAIFSGLGGELITNGGFGSGSSWTFPTGWSLSGGRAVKGANGTGSLSQNVSFWPFREYLLTYTVSGHTAGSFNVTLSMGTGSYTGPTRSANGTYTERIYLSHPAAALNFTPSNTARFSIDDVSLKPLTGVNTRVNLAVGGQSIEGNWSNSTPGTTRALTFSNDGSYSWTDYRFAGILRAAFGANNSGGVDTYFSGGNGAAWYSGNAGLTSNSLVAYLVSGTFTHYGYGAFLTGVHAGGISQPHTRLQSSAGFATGTAWKFASFSEDGSAGTYYCDASEPTCAGTPSTTSCASYTGSGQATCESHLPCAWFAGYSCSAFNGDQSSCQAQGGCTYDTASCSGVGAYDQTSCEAYSGCSWTNSPQDCSGFDESTCNGTSGCSAGYDYCYNYNDGGGDGTACAGVSGYGCTYDSGSGACSGDPGFWFTGCSGSYDSYSCDGSYFTGNCSGTYGATCSGTVSCSAYTTSGGCGGEPGCSWLTALNVTLPSAATVIGRIVTLYNASVSGADVNVLPTGGDTINLGASYTIADYKGRATFQAARDQRSCIGLTEAGCTPSGCSKDYQTCSWSPSENTCSGHASCAGYGDQATCEAATYYNGCNGTYTARIGWFLIGT